MNLFPSLLLSTVYRLFPFLGLTHGSWCSQSASLHQLTTWAVPLSNSTNPQSIVPSTAQRGPGSLSSYQIMSPQGTHSFFKVIHINSSLRCSSKRLLSFIIYFQSYPVPLDSKGWNRRAAELGSGPCLHRRGLPGALQWPRLLY